MDSAQDVVSLIDRWPALRDFARDAGVTYGAAKQMRRRSSIPVDYWPALTESLFGVSIGLTADVLMKAHSQKSEAA